MSFSSEIKNKLVKINGVCDDCLTFELAGFLGNSSKMSKECITLVTENYEAAKKISNTLREKYLINALPTYQTNIYKTVIHNDIAQKVLQDTKYLMKNLEINKECCMGAFVRGAFLGGGSINNPNKSYHMEFDYKYNEQAEKLRKLLENMGVTAKITLRKGHTVVYFKEYETIAGLLGVMGDGGAATEIYNISAEKEIRNGINRQMNCENANMDKVASAYCRHMHAIEKIKNNMGLEKLPDNLKETAEMRMNYPEDSLKDLGERFNPPIGKSGVNHRLNKLMDIAENL